MRILQLEPHLTSAELSAKLASCLVSYKRSYWQILLSVSFNPNKKAEEYAAFLLPLPPYAPELNPREHVWDYIREQKEFNNHTFESLDALDIQLGNVLCDLQNEKSIISSMCNFDWIKCATC